MKKNLLYPVLLNFVFLFNVFSQQNINSVFNFTLDYRSLAPEDITIPINFDKEKSPRNDSKLLLPLVRDIMESPLQSSGFIDTLSKLNDENILMQVKILLSLSGYQISSGSSSVISFGDAESLMSFLVEFVRTQQKQNSTIEKNFTKEEKTFLNRNLLSVISETEDDDGSTTDIFQFNKARDSSIAVSKRTLDILSKTDLNKIYTGLETCISIFEKIRNQKNKIENDAKEELDNENASGSFAEFFDESGIRIAIGGSGRNVYSGHFDFIIDTGGDDIYNISRESSDLFRKNFSCIIDLGGNDFYSTDNNYCLAGSAFSSGFIFDADGDDHYIGKTVSLGSAICGIGLLYDENGNDTYHANQFSIGAASFGAGVLIDKNGNDIYIANSYSQGFGMTKGTGAIIDSKGNDSYLIDARSLDIGRYEDHYISMSQGYGLGLRPFYAGGIGLIVESEGNDIYNTDIFGQGGAYWYGLGCIADISGNDKYNGYQYSQGAGIHLAVGLLKDFDGWDTYASNGVSQGCGHDFGFGFLHDVKGNDNYSAYSLSQGAGNANGIGILIDESGRDGYLNKEPGNTRGYGNSRREFGSLGIFLDGSGDDFYSNPGMDSTMTNSSMWGVMNDYFLKDLPSQVSVNNFKISIDTLKPYSLEDFFVMAKTIEPRFSQWQEFGFRKLVEDSIETSEYILKYLDTPDHRAGLVLRNLSQKITYTMASMFKEKLALYSKSMSAGPILNPEQVAFICYLFGETRNAAGKEELLGLTYDENIKIRSSAINALGKILIDTADTDFNNRVSKRLRELASESSGYKLYTKDIAYAFKNYKNLDNIATLIRLLGNNYFGVRFLAADDLTAYGDVYYEFLNDAVLNELSSDKIAFGSFLLSTINFTDEKFRELYGRIMTLKISDDEAARLKLADAIRIRILKTNNEEFRTWASEQILYLQSGTNLKVK